MKQLFELMVVAVFVVAESALAEFGMWEKCGLLVPGSLDVHLSIKFVAINSVIETYEGGMISSFVPLAREFT